MNSIFVLFILTLTHAQSYVEKSLCMNDFLAVNYEKVLNTDKLGINITKDNFFNCFAYIEGHEQMVQGFKVESQCYVYDPFYIGYVGPYLLPRCGRWVQIVGPTQKSTLCMMIGSYNLTIPGYEDIPYFFVTDSVFSELSPKTTPENKLLVPITVAETDLDLKMNPTLVVSYFRNNTNSLHFINVNRVCQSISIEGVKYEVETTAQYTVPYKQMRLVDIAVYAYDGEVIWFYNVDLGNKTEEIPEDKETITKLFDASSRFINMDFDDCYHMTESHVYNKGDYKRNKYMKWVLSSYNVDEQNKKIDDSVVYYSNKDQNFTIKMNNKRFAIHLELSSSSVIFSDDFKYIELIMKPSFNASLIFDHKESFMIVDETADMITEIKNFVSVSLPTRWYIDENNNIHMKMVFKRNNLMFSKGIEIINELHDEYVDTNDLFINNTLEVISIDLVRDDKINKQPECSSYAFDCYHTECTVPKKNFVQGVSLWESIDCIEACGSCLVGYYCNSSGFCVEDTKNNTRSDASFISILLMLLVILLFLI